jgi:hypothetical protein
MSRFEWSPKAIKAALVTYYYGQDPPPKASPDVTRAVESYVTAMLNAAVEAQPVVAVAEMRAWMEDRWPGRTDQSPIADVLRWLESR